MRRASFVAVVSLLSSLALLLPAPAAAQQASVAGAVTDVSGAVLPGVVVEASSPALIEKTRSVVTDGTGQYRIVGLPSGTYTVSYTLTGFNIVRREGVELAGALIVTIDIQMRVGAIEESVVVTGESPVVDVQSARRQQIIAGPVLAALPTSRSYNSVLQLVPSVVAGDGNLQLRPTMLLFTAHGGSTQDGRLTVDGINTGSSRGGSGVSSYVPDIQNTSEVAFSISGNLGEAETGGPQMTVVPKSGGNEFSGTFVVNGVNEAMQDSNYTDRLKAAGLTAPPKVIKLYDLQGSAGGPVKRDRLWFYFNYRRYGSADAQPGIFANKNAGDPTKWTYDPDFSLQGRTDVEPQHLCAATDLAGEPAQQDHGVLRLPAGVHERGVGGRLGRVPQHAARRRLDPGRLADQQLLRPRAERAGNRRLLAQPEPRRAAEVAVAGDEPPAGGSRRRHHLGAVGLRDPARRQHRRSDPRPGAGRDSRRRAGRPEVPLVEPSARTQQRPHLERGGQLRDRRAQHEVRVSGRLHVRHRHPVQHHQQQVPGVVPLQQHGAEPDHPAGRRVRARREHRIRGVLRAGAVDARTPHAAGRAALRPRLEPLPRADDRPDLFIPTPIVVPAEQGVRGFNNLSPRVGAAYDLRGNGKTSVKTYLGKYLSPATNQNRFVLTNPVERITTIVNRQWTDANADYIPQCDLMNPGLNGECGAWLDQTFGRPRPSTNFDPGILGGWGVRPGDWQFGLSVQHEVLPRVSLEVAYDRRWWQNFADVTDNLAVASADYDPFSIVAPADARLPDGGGYTISGLYDLDPSKLGQTDNFVRQADDYGGHTRYNDSVDITVNARLRNGLNLQGGTSTGRLLSDQCGIRDDVPEFTSGANVGPVAPYCQQNTGFLTTYKTLAAYTVPKIDLLLSGTFSSRPGVSLSANLVVPSSQIAPSLGRPLSGGANVTINLLAPNTMFGDRINQVDMRVGKLVRFGTSRATFSLDVLNLFNTDAILAYNPTFNATWPTPTTVITARLARVSAQFDW